MRMNDYEWDFVKDSIDKKNVARSARSTRTHCGKAGAVKFPSDYLTKKELKAMSGEVIEYASLKKPMSWEEFKALPTDLKKEYIINIRERFSAPDKYVAEMLGVSGACFGLYVRDLGLGVGKDGGNGNRKWKTEEFFAWRSGADENAEVAPVEPTTEDVTPTVDSSSLSDAKTEGGCYKKVAAVPTEGKLTFDCPADEALNMVSMILGNTRVKLTVKWEMSSEDDGDERTED